MNGCSDEKSTASQLEQVAAALDDAATQRSELSKALRKMTDAPQGEQNETLRAALAKVSESDSAGVGFRPSSSLGELSKTHETLRAALKRTSLTHRTEATRMARRAGIRHGFVQLAGFNLNPWLEWSEGFEMTVSPSESLEEDWRRISNDLWTTIDKLRDQLDDLPTPVRARLIDALVEHLQASKRV